MSPAAAKLRHKRSALESRWVFVGRDINRSAAEPQPKDFNHGWTPMDTDFYRRLVSRNAGFIRQRDEPRGPLPDKSGVPVVASRCPLRSLQESFCWAASGISILVVPTSLISVVVVSSLSRSWPLKVTVPASLSSYLVRAPSLSQNLTEPLAFLGSAALPAPPRPPRASSSLAPASVRSLE